MSAAPLQKLLQTLCWCHALVIDPVCGNGIVYIADRHHATVFRDLITLQALRIACAVEAFVVLGRRDDGELANALCGSQNVP